MIDPTDVLALAKETTGLARLLADEVARLRGELADALRRADEAEKREADRFGELLDQVGAASVASTSIRQTPDRLEDALKERDIARAELRDALVVLGNVIAYKIAAAVVEWVDVEARPGLRVDKIAPEAWSPIPAEALESSSGDLVITCGDHGRRLRYFRVRFPAIEG